MYLPEQFAENDTVTLHDLIAAVPLGTLVTFGAEGEPESSPHRQ